MWIISYFLNIDYWLLCPVVVIVVLVVVLNSFPGSLHLIQAYAILQHYYNKKKTLLQLHYNLNAKRCENGWIKMLRAEGLLNLAPGRWPTANGREALEAGGGHAPRASSTVSESAAVGVGAVAALSNCRADWKWHSQEAIRHRSTHSVAFLLFSSLFFSFLFFSFLSLSRTKHTKPD